MEAFVSIEKQESPRQLHERLELSAKFVVDIIKGMTLELRVLWQKPDERIGRVLLSDDHVDLLAGKGSDSFEDAMDVDVQDGIDGQDPSNLGKVFSMAKQEVRSSRAAHRDDINPFSSGFLVEEIPRFLKISFQVVPGAGKKDDATDGILGL